MFFLSTKVQGITRFSVAFQPTSDYRTYAQKRNIVCLRMHQVGRVPTITLVHPARLNGPQQEIVVKVVGMRTPLPQDDNERPSVHTSPLCCR